MGLIDWTEGLSVGIPAIDAQHRKLIGLMNRLDEARRSGKPRAVLGDIVRELDAYTKVHFEAEERLFDLHAYPDSRVHKAEHAAFVGKVTEFELAFAIGKAEVGEELLGFLKTWLTRHIAFSDRKYRPYVKDLRLPQD